MTQSITVPLLDLKAQYAPLRKEIEEKVLQVLASQHFIMGPEVAALEKELEHYLEVKYAIGVSSGSDALILALMALDIGVGDEVIVPAYSFFATAGAVAVLGAKPVFVDIREDDFNIDVEALEKKISPTTKAIMPVHLFGQSADMDPLMQLAARHKLAVIEDAAQAIGVRHKGKRVGSIGTIGCFSFFPSKNLGACGDGGLVTTNDDELGKKIKRLRVHGSEPKYYHALVGVNARLDALQAAILRIKLKHLDSWSEKRRSNAELYRTLFAQHKNLDLVLPVEHWSGDHIYNQFVVMTSRRDRLQQELSKAGVGSEVYYPLPLPHQQCFSQWGYVRGDFPVSEKCASQSLALPIYPELTEEQLRYVVETVARVCKA